MDKYDNIKDANGERILASGIALAMTGKDSTVLANVRLIAAAPALLEALERCLAHFERIRGEDAEDSPMMAQARAACKQARGE